MESEYMDSGDESSSFESVVSFVCDICQGFGDMKNPRGFIMKLEPEEKFPNRDDECYVYAYMHHPNVGTLLVSKEEGCDVCAIVCSSLRSSNHDVFDEQVALCSPVGRSEQPDSIASIVQTNGETWTATLFAGVLKQDRAFTEDRLRKYDNGRIVLIVRCDQEAGPRGSSKTSQHVDALVMGLPALHMRSPSFTVFNSACASHFQQEIGASAVMLTYSR